uniref:Uncharacterized protein n=1 Tax=Nitratidesulfovibrio vulgaris (strain DSM 19637 / Miyazaki F) TaxID=883 RepID=B8DN06_NITV9
MHDDVEHLLKRHQSAMERHERTMRDAERKRRSEEERLDQAYEALRQRLCSQPDPDAGNMVLPPPPGMAGPSQGTIGGLLGSLRALLF